MIATKANRHILELHEKAKIKTLSKVNPLNTVVKTNCKQAYP